MSRAFSLIVAAVALSFSICGDALAKCSPHRTMKIVTRIDDPEIPADHFARRPKTMYRLGQKFGRMEELPNGETGVHLLIVVNEPDIWIVNRADKTGKHAVDPGPTFNFRAPLIGDLKSELWNNFEFGCEVPFMQGVKASRRTDDTTGSTIYEHEAEGVQATLEVSKSGIPQRVTIKKGDGVLSYLYDSYEQLDNADTDLFVRPAGISFTEAEP